MKPDMRSINRRNYGVLTSRNYKKLSLNKEKYLIDKFLCKKNRWRLYTIKKLKYEEELLIIITVF